MNTYHFTNDICGLSLQLDYKYLKAVLSFCLIQACHFVAHSGTSSLFTVIQNK